MQITLDSVPETNQYCWQVFCLTKQQEPLMGMERMKEGTDLGPVTNG